MSNSKVLYNHKDPLAINQARQEIDRSLKMGLRKFERVDTSYTSKYLYEDTVIDLLPDSTDLSGVGAGFIGRVKKYFADKPLPERLSDNAPFCEYFKPISTYKEITELVEVDLNKAYWKAALNLGYLSGKLYSDALSDKINKKARLIALGVLGKKTVTKVFTPPYDDVKSTEQYANTRPFWDNIVYTVGQTLEEATNHFLPHIYGVWFDAIFIHRSQAQGLRRFLQRRGYPASTDIIKSYIVTPRDGIRPGAKIKRVFANGDIKEMDVPYRTKEDKELDFSKFENLILQSLKLT